MKLFRKFFACLAAVLVPLALTFLGLRLLLTHIFPEVEYRLPDFPADPYGFTLDDRLRWSKISITYLQNNADISFLGSLIFPDGLALFNERELSHMRDVKQVVKPVLWIGYGTWIVLGALAIWAWKAGWWRSLRCSLRWGGLIAAGLVVLVGILAVFNFWEFFSLFHGLFFTGDSWQFFYSDTLIRLFPMRFWQDAFLFAGTLDLAGGLALWFGLKPKREPGVVQMI